MADQFDDRYSSQAAVDLARRLAVPRSEKVAPPSRRAATPAMFAQNAYYPEDENRAAERQRLLENKILLRVKRIPRRHASHQSKPAQEQRYDPSSVSHTFHGL